MKKILLPTLLSSFLVAGNIEIGGGYLTDNLTGLVSVESKALNAKYDLYDKKGTDSNRGYGYIDIKIIPLLPNILIDYQAPKYHSKTLNTKITAYGQSSSANSVGNYNMETNQIGGYLYYDALFFLPFISLDLGIGAKYVDYNLEVKDNGLNQIIYQDSDQVILPLVYIHPDIRISNIEIEVKGKGISYDGSEFYEVNAGVKYWFNSIGIEGGYYYNKLKTDGDNDLFSGVMIDTKTDGFYVGLSYKF